MMDYKEELMLHTMIPSIWIKMLVICKSKRKDL
jgi:hypothetical protein